MKKHWIPLAGLTLAATLYSLPVFGQGPTPPPKGPPPGRPPLVEVEAFDEDDPMGIARAVVGDTERTVRRLFAGPAEAMDRPLIIATSQTDEKSLANLNEDLNIMARVLNKSVERRSDEADRKAMGIHLWALGGGNRGARNLYIEGHGAIFTLNVNMPLLAPPTKPQAEEKKEPTNSTWEEARNELYGRDNGPSDFKRKPGDKRPPAPYDAARVEELKQNLVESLKNASHIRGLKDNEHVTVVVQGAGASNVQTSHSVGHKGESEKETFAFAFAGSAPAARSTMTLRAKKSDIDAFAKGKTEIDDFRKKVAIAVYQTPAGEPARGR